MTQEQTRTIKELCVVHQCRWLGTFVSMSTLRIAQRLVQLRTSDSRTLEKPAYLIPFSDWLRLLKARRKDKQLSEEQKLVVHVQDIPVYPIPDGVIVEYEYDEEERIMARILMLAKS